jgi:hypothetical protein
VEGNKADILKCINNISERINEKRAENSFFALQRGKLRDKNVRSSSLCEVRSQKFLMKHNVIVEDLHRLGLYQEILSPTEC